MVVNLLPLKNIFPYMGLAITPHHLNNPHVQSSLCTHTMTTWSMNNIHRSKQFNSVTKHPLPLTIELSYVSQALYELHWRQAIFDELTTLMRHGTWKLISPPTNCNPVGCKWIFHVKRKSDESVDRFKVRLVAKGFNQRKGLD